MYTKELFPSFCDAFSLLGVLVEEKEDDIDRMFVGKRRAAWQLLAR
jgi:hypothetical protein